MKQIKMGIIMIIAVTLFGCNNSEKTITVCKGSAGMYAEEVELTAEGDKVKKQIITQSLDIASVGTTEEALKPEIEEVNKRFNDDLKGVKFRYSFTDGKLVMVMELDYEKASVSKLAEAGILEVDGKQEDGVVGLKTTKSVYGERGYTCKKR